ncbi:MAG: hypothetical protein MPL62_16890 [Alphaproteobacteria bacterium]|nr:hypothetical protein [Alphaproteobacteria bacterium]
MTLLDYKIFLTMLVVLPYIALVSLPPLPYGMNLVSLLFVVAENYILLS